MHFSLLFSTGLGASFSNTGFMIAIAVLALILGAEIAGIGVLVSKLVRARNRRFSRTEEDAESRSNHADYAALLLFGAVPQSTYLTLTVLAGLTALFAVVFLVLLIIFRVRGYDFASSGWYQEETARRARPTQPEPAETLPEEDAPVAASVADTVFDEEQRQEAYTEAAEESAEPLDVFAEETDSAEIYEESEPVVEILGAEETDSAADAVAVAPVSRVETVTAPADGEPAFADGSHPYKIVEKYVTETYKEVYKETPAPAADTASAQNTATNEAVMEKLSDILDELQKRNERDASTDEKAPAQKKDADGDSISVFAADALEDDEDDEDEDDELTADGGKGDEDDEDRDDEENDTEGDHFTGNERIIGFDEKTGCYIVAHYRKSFEAKLIQARPNIKKYYSELKNALLSYKGTKNRISWTADSFHNGRTPIAKINVKTRILELYLALDPASLEGTVYRGKDVGSKKKYADTPFQYKLRTPRKFKWALELIQRVCEEHGLSPIDIEPVDYEAQYPFDTTENLVARNLIKEYIREEKPATSFELAPDHVPAVPDEDDSVIPANANFSWEFDNEVMEEKEPEPIPEEPAQVEEAPIEEPVVEPTPEPTAAPAPAASITRETVKITEMRYTERYYANAEPSYERVITTTEPIEAIALPAAEAESAEDPSDVAANAAPTSEDGADAVEIETEAAETADASEDGTADETETDGSVDIWGDLTTDADVQDEDATEETEEVEEVEESDEIEATEEAEENEELFFAEPETDEEDEADETADEYTEESFAEWEEIEGSEPAAEDEEASRPASVEVVEPVEEPVPAPRRVINPNVAVVDIASLEAFFPDGAVINLETLKERELILPSATTLKIYTGGGLTKSFTVEANHFTMDAITAIGTANGDIVVVR